jgi:Uma2 family endonuclease
MPSTALVTSEQYLALPDEFDQNGNRIKDELIGGEIVKAPLASLQHDVVKNEISRVINRYLATNPDLALECNVGMGTLVSKYDTFVPDVSVMQIARLSAEARIFLGPPELAIEVVSPVDSNSHLKAKVAAYLANGSHSVWVVYPESRSVMVHERRSVREVIAEQRIEDALLAGFSAPVSSFFELA